MKVDRRAFMVAGLGAMASACHHPFLLDVSEPWMAVDIYGLSALVLDDSDQGGLSVILIDGPATGHDMPQHFPALVAPLTALVVKDSEAPTAKFTHRTTLEEMAYWDLTGLRVSVDASPGDKVIPIKTSVDRKAGDYLPLPGMYGDVSWIPEMARLTESGKGRIEKASFAADPGSAKVAARTHFGSGQLTAAFRKRDMGLGYDEVEFEFEPQPKSGPYRQALAAARLIQQLTSGSVTFKLQRFGPGTMPKPVVLRVPATNGGPLEVGLTNESVKPGGAGTCKNNDDVQILKHFKAYYDLLDPMDRVDDEDKRPIPRAVGATTPKCGAGNEIIWCPPMMFSKPGRTA